VNDSSCRSFFEFNLNKSFKFDENIASRTLELFLKCSTTKNSYVQCPKPKSYRCVNSSKCLSLHRLFNGFLDCVEGGEEQIKDSSSLPDVHYHFRCWLEDKCIPLSSLDHRNMRCAVGEDEEWNLFCEWIKFYSLSFQTLYAIILWITQEPMVWITQIKCIVNIDLAAMHILDLINSTKLTVLLIHVVHTCNGWRLGVSYYCYLHLLLLYKHH
jgi:hypothetical protein